MENTDLEIKSYIRKALENQKFVSCKIVLTGSTEKSEGYASHITFATVVAITEEGIEKNIDVAVKISKKDFMKMYGKLYTREAYFYDIVLSEFSKFQTQNNITDIFNSVPKCYKTIVEENSVVIIMENLRKNGYSLYDRKKPLNLDHLRLVLREYGKFHAISFALRAKGKDYFEKLFSNFDDVVLILFTDSFRGALNDSMKRACNILKETNEIELYETYHSISEKGIDVLILDALNSIEPESAILHGDCWNNNFIYKYEDNDHKLPSKVAILDWQLSRLHSPAFDLSYFIYTNCSEEQLKHFDELLGVYYTSFSAFLTEMGCDSAILFPYSTLQKHWKKYSLYGLAMVISFLHVILCDKEDAPDFNENKDGTAIADALMNVQIKDEVEYRTRLVAVLKHYYKYSQ